MEIAHHASGAEPITGQLLSAFIIPHLLGMALVRNHMVINVMFLTCRDMKVQWNENVR